MKEPGKSWIVSSTQEIIPIQREKSRICIGVCIYSVEISYLACLSDMIIR